MAVLVCVSRQCVYIYVINCIYCYYNIMPCQIFNFFMDFVFGICVFICRKKVTIKDEVEVLLKSSLIFIILNQGCFHKRLKHMCVHVQAYLNHTP